MLELKLPLQQRTTARILCLGAHSDDIEIGCGGTIMRLIDEHPHAEFLWVVFSASPEREEEARRSAALFLSGAQRATVEVHRFRDGFFPYLGGVIKEEFEHLKRHFDPDLIFTHQRHDLHQDHQAICNLTWNTFRNHTILEYEIPKYDGDLGNPNLFFYLTEALCRRKVQHLMDIFGTQRSKAWFTEDTFMALLRLRVVESQSPTRFAEAFYARKLAF